MKKKMRARRTPINSNVERLDHMIDQSLVRKKNFKPYQNYSNERALFEMIDTRIGHMLAKSCEIESKIEAIEKKRPKRKQNFDTNNNFITTNTIYTRTKKKASNSPQSIISVESTETEESIPQLQSASKFLLEENRSSSNNQQQFAKKQKTQQKQEVLRQQRKQTTIKNNQKKEEINFFQQEQEEEDNFFQPKQQSSTTKDVSMESLISLIQTLAKEVHEMHEEQVTLKNQIEELQEYVFSNE